MTYSASVYGVTGLVGAELVKQLIADDSCKLINIFSRRSTVFDGEIKVNTQIIDFNKLEENFAGNVDVVFCCIGTTIKKAGDKESFRKVDYDIPVNLARLCNKYGVAAFAVVSSLGASSNTRNFYLRVKGEMEEEVKMQNLKNCIILRPSLLLGKRNEFRFGEIIGKGAMFFIKPFMFGGLAKYKGVNATKVAQKMISTFKTNQGFTIIENNEIDT